MNHHTLTVLVRLYKNYRRVQHCKGHHQGIRSSRAIAFILLSFAFLLLSYLLSYFAQRIDRSSAHHVVKKEGTKTQHCSTLRSYILKQQQHSPFHRAPHPVLNRTRFTAVREVSSLCALYSLGFRMFSSFTMSAANARMPSESFSVAIASSLSA
jgi:hypothetical protein